MDFVEWAYGIARDWHIQPSEFWAMSIEIFWWEFDAKLQAQKRMEEQMEREKITNGFSGADWADAKARHKEKLNG